VEVQYHALPLSALVLLLAPAQIGVAGEKFEPVLVVQDAAAIESRLQTYGVPFEATFVASLNDARRARRDLRRFVRTEIKRVHREDRRHLRRILSLERDYIWHCGGFERSGGRYLHCSFVRQGVGDEHLKRPVFPAISDGGTDVGRCVFSIKTGQIVTIAWNNEA
jgi:hypothetical protein